MSNTTKTFSKEFLKSALLGTNEEVEVVSDTLVKMTLGMGNHFNFVFKFDGVYYSVPCTEVVSDYQFGQPWEYKSDQIENDDDQEVKKDFRVSEIHRIMECGNDDRRIVHVFNTINKTSEFIYSEFDGGEWVDEGSYSSLESAIESYNFFNN